MTRLEKSPRSTRVSLCGSVPLWTLVIGGLWSWNEAAAAEPAGVAVVELFTSEGCSSCPSADRLLQKIVEAHQKTGSPVYCIGWHVDYWDRLGWPDRLADRRYTRRQHMYAQKMELRAVYTPQTIVNGTDEFVGSDAKLSTQSIANGLRTPARHRVQLTVRRGKTADAADIDYSVSPAAPGQLLQLVLVETGLKTDVKAGENRGESLVHANAARAWTTVRLGKENSGTAALTLPTGAREPAVRVIAFVQSPETLFVSGAADAAWVADSKKSR
ncbi:MAG: DUF1223 domain-containing protein [Planctomycetaceae bacterium]|nr:DUF1223 domain-containing protein [Planctomycetaceae bacterium]